jgi:DNA repair protein RadC
MKNLEKLIERLEKEGIGSFGNDELLRIVLNCTEKRALSLLKERSFRSLYFNMERDDIKLTKLETLKLKSIYEINKRRELEKSLNVDFKSTSDTRHYIEQVLWNERMEKFIILGLDNQNKLIKTYQTVGTVNEAVIYVRDVVKFILQYDISNIILGHNHPGGSLNPSSHDINITKKIKEASGSICVKVHDHIIVGLKDGVIDSFSFAEQGLI